MAKNSITDYSKTASLNTDIQSVDIDEGCLPSGINNAIRELMTDLAEMNDGTVTLTSPAAGSINITGNITVGGTVDGRDVATDGSKLDGVEASADVTDTANVTAAGAAMLTGATFTGSITAPDATFNGTTAVKLPAGTDAQRPTGVNGMLRYNSDDAQFEGYADGAWGAIAGGGETSFLLYSYTATSGQTTFSGSDDNSATLSYTASNIIVTLNGITLENGTDYTATNGTSIVLTVGASAGDELNVVAFKSFTVSDTVAASTGGTFNGNVAVTGDLTVDTSTLKVDSTNNRVGIGTSSPAHELTVQNSTSDPAIRVHADTTSSPTPSIELMRGTNDTFGSDNYSDYRIKSTSGHLTFEHGANGSTDERMRIDNSGNLHIATGGSQAGATVSGTSIRSLDILKSTNTTSGFNQIVFYNPNGAVGTIRTTGSSTAYNTSSDYRLKENVIGITDGIERVKQLNPSRFNFIADADTTVDGFLAHEAATVVPEAVAGEKDAVDEDGNPEYQGIDQAKLVPLLTAALQEAITKIETLETQNADFETRLTALETNNE